MPNTYYPDEKTRNCWWRDGVIYQIYPRSFADSNGDGIGDLRGIISKLDYIQDLGVAAIWLSPITVSPDFDFGYDVSDYLDVDPKYGTLDDYKELLKEAHSRGIRVILDLVLNHSSTQHPWFQASKKSRDNEFSDYYLWRDGTNRKKPNNWFSIFDQATGWEYVKDRGQYYFHMFVKEQADLNWRNPKVYEEMMNIFRFWSDLGTDGFRLDVFNVYFKDESFRSNPFKIGDYMPFNWQDHIYDCDQPEMERAVRDIRAILNGYPERYVVGETFLSNPSKLRRYAGEDKLHAIFDFAFPVAKRTPDAYRKIIRAIEENCGNEIWPTTVSNNHDLKRSASRYGLGETDERLKIHAALVLLLRGTPFIYYGEEIGQRETKVPRAKLMDPVGKRFWPINKGRDGCRAPMQWNAEKNAGFSDGTPWNSLHPDYETRNVEAQQRDPQSLHAFYKDVIALRKQVRSFQVGSLELLDDRNEFVLAFKREFEGECAYVLLNFSQLPSSVRIPNLTAKTRFTKQFSNKEIASPNDKGEIKLAGDQALILVVKEDRKRK